MPSSSQWVSKFGTTCPTLDSKMSFPTLGSPMNRSLAQSTSSLSGLNTIMGMGAKSILLALAVSAPPEMRSTY